MEETCEITVMRHTDFVTMEGKKKKKQGKGKLQTRGDAGWGQGLPISCFSESAPGALLPEGGRPSLLSRPAALRPPSYPPSLLL